MLLSISGVVSELPVASSSVAVVSVAIGVATTSPVSLVAGLDTSGLVACAVSPVACGVSMSLDVCAVSSCVNSLIS